MTRTFLLLSFVCALSVIVLAQSVEAAKEELRKGHAPEAKKILDEILKKDKKNAEAHYWLGMTLLRRETLDVDEAVDQMEEAIDLGPDNADYHFGLGAALGTKAQNTNPLKQAWLAPKIRSSFAQAVTLNPKHIQAHLGLADFYQMAPGIMGGDNTKAWREADAVLALDELAGRSKRAQMFLRDKKVGDAEKEWKTLTTNLPHEWRGWKRLGLFYLNNGRPDDSLQPFEKFVELRPDTADSYDCLAKGYLGKNDFEQAITYSKKALDVDQNFISAIYTLAEAHVVKGQKQQAREYYQRGLALDSNEDRRKNVEKTLQKLQ